MNAPLKPGSLKLDPVEVFRAQAEARAMLCHCGELDLHEAVDPLQSDAVTSGLVREIGQDDVQRIIASAFHRERGR